MTNQSPPDRAAIATEARLPESTRLHALSVADAVQLINAADQRVINALRDAQPALTALINDAEPGFTAGGRLVYVGAGTSGRLGVLDAAEAPPTFHVHPRRVVGIIAGGDAALRVSSESLEDDPEGAAPDLQQLELDQRDTVIGIAAGGTTPYPRGALAVAKRAQPRCTTAFISCAPVDTPRHCDHHILLDTGPEVLTGSTRMKAGTATKLALNTISTVLMVREGRVYQNLMVDLKPTNDKLRDRAARIIATLTGIDRAAALNLLHHANDNVKAAILCQRLHVEPQHAQQLLDQHQGRLDRALGEELHQQQP